MKRKSPDTTLAKILFILRDIYTRQYQQYQHASLAHDIDGIASAQSAMLTCEEVASNLNIVLFSDEEKQSLERSPDGR